MKKYDVNCASCCGTFHETTVKFDSSRMATGDMLTLKQAHKDNGWGSFPEYDSTDYPDLVCPSCGMMYCDNTGKVIRLQENGEIKDTKKVEPVAIKDTTDIATGAVEDVGDKLAPEFGEDGRAQCPYCGQRVNKQWWTRHIAKHQKSD